MRGGRTNSFLVHIPTGLFVILMGVLIPVSRMELLLLIVCVGMVISAELFNSALERLAESITDQVRAEIRDALDIASGAVLAICVCVSMVGAMILLPYLLEWIA